MHSAGMPTTLEQANELIYKLLDRIAELEDRLNQHSGNSSKPPSSDGPGAPPPARKRPASGTPTVSCDLLTVYRHDPGRTARQRQQQPDGGQSAQLHRAAKRPVSPERQPDTAAAQTAFRPEF